MKWKPTLLPVHLRRSKLKSQASRISSRRLIANLRSTQGRGINNDKHSHLWGKAYKLATPGADLLYKGSLLNTRMNVVRICCNLDGIARIGSQTQRSIARHSSIELHVPFNTPVIIPRVFDEPVLVTIVLLAISHNHQCMVLRLLTILCRHSKLRLSGNLKLSLVSSFEKVVCVDMSIV